jgi:two-component sensor histidine kinase
MLLSDKLLERAIPCGLLLSELITNSLKYAFPNKANGQIWVKLQPEYEDVTLMYRDNGIGLPAGLNWENAQSLVCN